MGKQTFCTECGTRLRDTAVEGMCPGCLLRAGMSSPVLAAELEALFPQLEVFELIGQGGMGAVYRARQRSLDREVALKLLPSRLAKERGFAERFQREAQTLARLNHPHIVSIHDFGCAEGHYYLVMEFVRGVNLRQLLRQRSLQPEEALAVVPQVCEALQYAHDQGVVHRDIKPENILLDRHGKVKIADFGLAKLTLPDRAAPTITATHQVMGTPRYMAPEQLEASHSVDHRADIYSLGLVFYEMLTGELPMGRFDPPSRCVNVDVRLDEVVLRALEREPERRYQQASEVSTAVDELKQPAPPPTGTAEERQNLVWAVLCVLIPGLAFAGAVWSSTSWPLLALFLTGSAAGGCMANPKANRGERAFTWLLFTLSVGCVVGSMWQLGSAWPLVGLAAYVWGMAEGIEEEQKKVAG